MNRSSPFDHRPDSELGAALRDALSGPDDAEFTRRVMARLGEPVANVGEPWDVLSRWAMPGVAAALVITAVATLWLHRPAAEADVMAGALEDTLRRSGEAVTPLVFLAASQPPDLDVMLATALETER